MVVGRAIFCPCEYFCLTGSEVPAMLLGIYREQCHNAGVAQCSIGEKYDNTIIDRII